MWRAEQGCKSRATSLLASSNAEPWHGSAWPQQASPGGWSHLLNSHGYQSTLQNVMAAKSEATEKES